MRTRLQLGTPHLGASITPTMPSSHRLKNVKAIFEIPGKTRLLKRLIRRYKRENKRLTAQNATLVECCKSKDEQVKMLWDVLSGPAKQNLILKGFKRN
jgi:hypothetical protein